MRNHVLILSSLMLALSACGEKTNLPGETDDLDYEEASAVCEEATTAEECRDLELDSYFCGAITSTDACVEGEPTVYEGCVATQTTCTQFSVWLETEDGCREFDGCYAPTDDYPSCDPALDCPTGT